MKRFLAVVLLSFMCFTLFACSDKNDIKGTWECEVSVLGKDVPEGEHLAYITFKEDGKCTYVYYADKEEFSKTDMEYTATSSQFTLKYEGRELVCEYKIDEDIMTVTYNGSTQTMKRVKEG